MQTIYTKRWTREEVGHDVLAFAQAEGNQIEFIDFDIETNQWVVRFRHDDSR